MKIAVIGAGGFIGNRLVEQFHLGLNRPVVPIVRQPCRLALPARFDVEWRIANALDPAALARALHGCDAVVHAALGDPRQIEAMPEALTAAAATAGIKRVVYLSTASVHGQAPAPGTTEVSPLHHRHSMEYNNAKVRAEQSFLHHCERHRLSGFALRPGIVYGPRSRWITETAHDLRHGQAWLLDGGHGICNGIYVDNLCTAVAAALAAPAGSAGAYLVGDGETVTWRDFYHQLAEGLGVNPRGIVPLEKIPVFKRPAGAGLKRVIANPRVQRLLRFVPSRIKSTTKQFIAAANARPRPDTWRLPAEPALRITEEMVLLQQCRWKLPHQRAAEKLHYQPRVGFAEALQRSLAWLHFTEGRP